MVDQDTKHDPFYPVGGEEFSELLAVHKRISAGQKSFAVAVSGGPDSMALCYLLSEWLRQHDEKQNDVIIHALTVDHALRDESKEEASFVGEMLSSFAHVKHAVLSRAPASIRDSRIQEDARDDRYALMADYCQRNDLSDLFLAHHANDQAETILFRLAKGSGLNGLCGMKAQSVYRDHVYKDQLTLHRPFLGLEKQRLIDTCTAVNIPFVYDPSNKNTDFARVRLRGAHDILEAEGLTTKRLNMLADRMARAQEALDHYTDQEYERLVSAGTPEKITFDRDGYLSLNAEMHVRILIRGMKALSVNLYAGNSGYGPRFEKIEDLCRSLVSSENFPGRTLSGFIVRRDDKKGAITIEKEA